MLTVDRISKTIDGVNMLNDLSFVVNKGDKIAFVGPNGNAKSLLFDILMGETEADSGEYTWGITTTQAYFPKDNSKYFDGVDMTLVDWLRQYSKDQDETYLRGFLGRMLFSGEESLKKQVYCPGARKFAVCWRK